MIFLNNNRFGKILIAWAVLATYIFLSFVVIISIETLVHNYPKWDWAGTHPINLFTDVFRPALVFAILFFSIPTGLIALLPIHFTFQRRKKVHRAIEIGWYIFTIIYLWFGLWVTRYYTDCIGLNLKSDGSPLGGGGCGYWFLFSGPMDAFLLQMIIWAIWSAILLGMWVIIKRKILTIN